MPQFFVDQSFEVGCETKIVGGDAHHIIHVLRLQIGDWLVLSDGKGRSFRAEISSVRPKEVRALIIEEIKRRMAAPPPVLAFAIIKHDRSELIIQKAVELGCTNIIPFSSQRTIPKYQTIEKKLKRWQEIAIEAAKQSGLPFMPQIATPVDFNELCDLIPKYEKTILFWEGEDRKDMRSINIPLLCKEGSGEVDRDLPHLTSPRHKTGGQAYKGEECRILLIIGPEGGFDTIEVEKAKSQGAITVSLGQQILRVETAAIAALAVVQYELGNLSTSHRDVGITEKT
jgi:16S rRNA (uracil1498-N3)-methyltransferase